MRALVKLMALAPTPCPSTSQACSSSWSLHLAKFFGIGVIAATAWIHLLPDAFANFTNPCLDGYWTVYGGANYVGLFGLTAGFLVQGIELFAVNQGNRTHAGAAAHHGHHHQELVSDTVTRSSRGNPENGLTLDDVVNSGHAAPSSANPSSANEKVATDKTPLSESSRVIAIGTLVLEAGIIFHSLIIGLALGTTADDGFTSLLIAVCFHQFTEGTALGVLIAQLPTRSLSKIYAAGILYPLTTPLGIAIGIAIRNTYNENSQTSILLQGIFDSLSAGILIYNAYCELISREINQNSKFRSLSTNLKATSMLCLYAGAGIMALIGLLRPHFSVIFSTTAAARPFQHRLGLCPEEEAMDLLQSSQPERQTYDGNCHCGAFKFTVTLPTVTTVSACKCRMCFKHACLWLLLHKRIDLVVVHGEETLKTTESGHEVKSFK
ncbi:high-affinity Zn(2+) transporter zrt1 [Geranomyces variabilis]|nr:high-affinity Zn(2+) transporter zrt1 [Geranomyces variabilis]